MPYFKNFLWCLALAFGFFDEAQPWQNSRARQWYEIGIRKKNIDKKIAALNKAIELEPSFVEALFNLGLAYKEKQDFARVEQYMLQAYSTKSRRINNDFEVAILYELATTYYRQGKMQNYEETLRQSKTLASDPPRGATISFELGRFLYQQNRYKEALAELQEGERLYPAQRDYFANLIQLAQAGRETQQLFEQKQASKKQHASSAEALKSPDSTVTVARFEQAAVEDSNDADVPQLLAEVQTVNEENTDSILAAYSADSTAETNLKISPALPSSYGNASDRPVEARASANFNNTAAAAVKAPANNNVSFYIGGAIAALFILPALGFFAFSALGRARLHLLRGNYAAAAQIYESVLKRHPGRVKLYPLLAKIYLFMGRRDQEAMKIYKMLLQLKLSARHRDEINAIVAQSYLTEGRADADAVEVLEHELKLEQRRR